MVDEADLVYLALKRFANGNADFSDALIAVVSEHRGCRTLLSFDDGTEWVDISGSDLSQGAAQFPDLTIAPDGTPYLVIRDDAVGGKATVKQLR